MQRGLDSGQAIQEAGQEQGAGKGRREGAGQAAGFAAARADPRCDRQTRLRTVARRRPWWRRAVALASGRARAHPVVTPTPRPEATTAFRKPVRCSARSTPEDTIAAGSD